MIISMHCKEANWALQKEPSPTTPYSEIIRKKQERRQARCHACGGSGMAKRDGKPCRKCGGKYGGTSE